MKRLYIIFGLLLLALSANAIDRKNLASYASSLQGKKKEALKTAVFNIIKMPDKPPISYSGLWEAYKTTDKRSDGYLRDWYSNSTSYVIGGSKQGANYKAEGDSYNREHLVPQSWFSEASPMKSDIVHVVPTDGWVNNKRSDYYLAEVKKPDNPLKPYNDYWSNNYCYYGKCMTSGYNGNVFEPNDEIKGDIARIYFYMATCYQDKITKWSGGLFTGTTYQPYADWYFTMLMRWAKNDPMDDVEIARNNAVYTKQYNRNLFVDFPYLAEYIWGDSINVPFNPYTSITTAADDDRYVNGGSHHEDDEVAPPVFSPEGGTYAGSVTVTISAASDVTILYTTDGTSPVDNGLEYESPILVTKNTTIKAVAVDDDGNMSDVVTAVYVVKATIDSEDIFTETFDLCDGTGGNSGGFSGSVASSSSNFKPDNEGWKASSYFGGDKCARFGSSSKPGVVTTPTFNINGETTFSFRAVPWGSDGTSLTLSVSGNATLSETNLTMKEGWTDFTVTLTGSGPVTVTFTPVKRFFLDEVNARAVITTPSMAGDVNKDGKVNVADIMLVVNMVLENIPQDPVTYDLDAADINGNDDIEVADVMGIVNIALGN